MFDVLLDGLAFGEGPRWHAEEQRLYFSDMHDQTVWAVDESGDRERVALVPGNPSGLGWLPDGRLLIVSMTDRKLLRREPDGRLELHADLSGIATFHCNDMVVDSRGRAYVGNFGFDTHGDPPVTVLPANLAIVEPDGIVRPGPGELMFPNGSVISTDGRTLIVAETYAGRLTAFSIAADGSLGDRWCWARLPEGCYPDGIAMDAAGDLWVANAASNQVLLVAEGGEIRHTLSTSQRVFACMLGGGDGRTLFALTAQDSEEQAVRRQRAGRLEVTRVAVGRCGARP